MKRRLYLSFLTLLMPLLLSAQGNLSNMEIGVNAGGMNYIGDLNDQSMLGKPNLAYGGLFRYKLDNRWSIVCGASYGHVEGGNPDVLPHRNLSFSSYIFEGYLRTDFNFFPFGFGDMRFRWTPYIFGGFGFFKFNPTAYYIDPLSGEEGWYELQPLCTEGQGLLQYPDRSPYSLLQLTMPFGLGVKFLPSKYFTVTAEYGWRKTWTDYLDDCSTTYVDNDLLNYENGEIAAALADRTGEVDPGYVNASGIKRGDDSLDDWFAYFNVSATVSFELLFGWMMKKKCNIK